jgi:hypothetical protein
MGGAVAHISYILRLFEFFSGFLALLVELLLAVVGGAGKRGHGGHCPMMGEGIDYLGGVGYRWGRVSVGEGID